MATTNELGECSKVHLTIHVPKGRVRPMRKLLKPLVRAADPTLSLLHVHDTHSPVANSDLKATQDVPRYTVGCEVLSTPALSIMAFLPEDGTADEARDKLQNFPWKFHHRIELMNSGGGGGGGGGEGGGRGDCVVGGGGGGGGGMVSGKQEFFSLSRQYPLCSVCSCPTSTGCTVRFNLFVRNYRAMLEFYRLLTDSEMESTKPDFALFTVNTNSPDFSTFTSSYSLSSSLSSSCSSLTSLSSSSSSRRRGQKRPAVSNLACSVQLALKHCPYLDPYPLTSAYLTLFVRNMTALMTVLPGKVVQFAPNSFLVRDPDGNCVIAHDVEPAFVPRPSRLLNKARSKRRTSGKTGSDAASAAHAQEVVSTKLSSKGSSCCESQDSGRFSDSERGSSELDQCLERLVKEVSLNITDYSESSTTDSDCSDHSDSCLCPAGAVGGQCSKSSSSAAAKCRGQCCCGVSIGPLGSIRHDNRKVVYL